MLFQYYKKIIKLKSRIFYINGNIIKFKWKSIIYKINFEYMIKIYKN
jgi:hypothetical protein